MRIAIGMVVRNFVSAHPLIAFLDNAEKYGHRVDRAIVVYSHEIDPAAVRRLADRAKLSLIRVHAFEKAERMLRAHGVRREATRDLLFCPLFDAHGLVPYGFNRNHVLMEALFEAVDVLLFVDSDVQPAVLRRMPDGAAQLQEIDFVGAHLRGISMGADVTSSDYTGYSILPPARFGGMVELLCGLHKEAMADFWLHSNVHGGLAVQENDPGMEPASKVLGGNLGIRIGALAALPAFFSPYYFFDETPLLARGEDTLWGLAAAQRRIRCLDVHAPIFHDTYGNYPAVPDLCGDAKVRDRLYYACTGWIGRNVFLRWKAGCLPEEFAQRDQQLSKGAEALYRYADDDRFLRLPEIQRAAEAWLPEMAEQYRRLEEAWNEFTERWFRR